MMDQRFLFDSSSFIYALKKRRCDIFHKNYIHQLTLYEVLNALWKEVYLIKNLDPDSASELVKLASKIFENINILNIHPYEEDIFRMAVELGLTIYDASYVVLADKMGLTLVTEDHELHRKAGDIVNIISLTRII